MSVNTFAPRALAVHDVSSTGACADLIRSHCPSTEAFLSSRPDVTEYGIVRNGICLKKAIEDALEKKEMLTVPEDCEIEISEYFDGIVKRGVLNSFPEVATDCSSILENECRNDTVIECVEREKVKQEENSANAKCFRIVFSLQKLRANFWEFDPRLWIACEGDVKTLCPDVSRTNLRDCLQSKSFADLSEGCDMAMFDNDFRKMDAPAMLDQGLQHACRSDLSRLCVEERKVPGKLLECLHPLAQKDLETLMVWNFRKSRGDALSPQALNFKKPKCRAAVVKLQTRTLMDHRLNPAVRNSCGADIDRLCAEEKVTAERTARPSNIILGCLAHNFVDIESNDCALAIHKVISWQQLGMQHLGPSEHKHCRKDFEKFCTNQPGLECFSTNFPLLEVDCQQVLIRIITFRDRHPDYDPILKHTCRLRIDEFCDHGPNTVHCLLSNIDKFTDSDAACSSLLQRGIELSQQDYRLRYGVSQFCQDDIATLCPVNSTAVLSCLRNKLEKIQASKCITEVEDVIRGGSLTVNRGLCQGDVEKYCSDVNANISFGKVHHCLLAHLEKLSDGCATEEFNLALAKGNRIQFRPNLQRACKTCINKYCTNLPDDGSIIYCLEETAHDDCSPECQQELLMLLQEKHRDYRLSPDFALQCRVDIKTLCYQGTIGKDDEDNADAVQDVVQCMIDKRKEVTSSACLDQVKRKIRQRSFDVRIGASAIGNACQNDMNEFCADIALGQGRMHECLMKHIDQLEADCKVMEFKNQVAIHEDLRLDPTLANACKSIIPLCANAKQDFFECLLDMQMNYKTRVPRECKEVISSKTRDKINSWWFNDFIVEHCVTDLNQFIKQKKISCQNLPLTTTHATFTRSHPDASRILCITDNFRDIESDACRQSARLHVQLQVTNPLYNRRGFNKTCAEDAIEQCDYDGHNKDPDHGYEVYKCLLQKKTKGLLNPRCNNAVTRVLSFFFTDSKLHPKIANRCAHEIEAFCHDGTGSAYQLTCLKRNSENVLVSESCRGEINALPVPDDLMKLFAERQSGTLHLDEHIEKLTAQLINAGAGRDFFTLCGMLTVAGLFFYIAYSLFRRVRQKGYTFVPKAS